MTTSALGGQTPNFQSNLQGRIFRTRMIRDKMGPDDPIYHLLMLEAKRDVFSIFDDFTAVLDTDDNFWTASTNGGTAPAQLTGAGDVNGIITLTTGGTNDNDSTLLSEGCFNADHRPVALFRMQMNTGVSLSKFEIGFADADPGATGENSGLVLVKATPTSTATDYAVIIRDTEDNASIDLHADGTTDAAISVASSPGITFTTQVFYDFMIAVNEQRECYFWIDSVFQGVVRRGPENDGTTTLGLWAFCQTRTSGVRTMYIDYILAWQERFRLPRSVN